MDDINYRQDPRGTVKPKAKADEELRMVKKLKLRTEYMPAIQDYVKKGGTVESFLRQTVPIAYARLAAMMVGDDSALAYKAAVELLNRALGKPVEKKQVLYADINDVPEKQIDAEILRALKKDPTLVDSLIQADERRVKISDQAKKKRQSKMVDMDEND